MALDEKQRYQVYRRRNGKCHYCGTRLKWEAYQVKGLSGGWEIAPIDDPDLMVEEETDKYQALCYRCLNFEGRKPGTHLFIDES